MQGCVATPERFTVSGVDDDTKRGGPGAEEMLGRNMRRRREDLGLSQGAFAERMADRGFKWMQTTVYKVELGQRSVRLEEAVAIAGILGVRLDDLIGSDFALGEALDALDAATRQSQEAAHALESALARVHHEVETFGGIDSVPEYLRPHVRHVLDHVPQVMFSFNVQREADQ